MLESRRVADKAVASLKKRKNDSLQHHLVEIQNHEHMVLDDSWLQRGHLLFPS